MLTEEKLREALDFYKITEPGYEAAMRRCMTRIREDDALLAAFQKAERKLYRETFPEEYMLYPWLNAETLFGGEMPLHSTNLLLLSGYDVHRENLARYPLDEAQRRINFGRLRDMLLLVPVAEGQTSVGGVFWDAQFVNTRVVELGILQYEYLNIDGTLPRSLIGIHIPGSGRLDREAVDASMASAAPYLRQVYGYGGDEFVCTSWLLSPQLGEFLSPDSNLGYFRSLFSVEERMDCTADVLHYVFHAEPDADLKTLPEKTSLQRKVKAYLLAGGSFLYGRGTRPMK